MASLRKRPQPPLSEEAPPIATAAQGARLPEPTTEQAAPEPNPVDVKPSAAVEQAEQDAIKKRIAEMEGAERIQGEVLDQQQRFAKERQAQAAQIPAHIQRWAEEHPHYVHDPLGQAELNVALMKAARGGKTWNDSDFVETVERHLGIRQAEKPAPSLPYQPPARQAAPRQAPPQRQYKGPAVSAPPTRDVPGFSGRPQNYSAQLSPEEASIARALNLDPEIYRQERDRMRRIQASERN